MTNKPSTAAETISLAWDGPQGHKGNCAYVSGKTNLVGCTCGWTAYCDRKRGSIPAPSRNEAELLREKQLDADQAWEFLLSKNVPNLDIERVGKDKVTLVELLVEYANGVCMGREPELPKAVNDGLGEADIPAPSRAAMPTVEECADPCPCRETGKLHHSCEAAIPGAERYTKEGK